MSELFYRDFIKGVDDMVIQLLPLREADKLEYEALTGMTDANIGLLNLCYVSPVVKLFFKDGKPTYVFGATESVGEFTEVWGVGTNDMYYGGKELREFMYVELKKLHNDLTTFIGNKAHVKNKLHIRWLKSAGFLFGREVVINGNKFITFWKSKEE